MKIIILSLLYSLGLFAQQTVSEINCSEGGCFPDNTINVYYNSSDNEKSMNWINSFSGNTLRVYTPINRTPRNALIYASNGNPTKKIEINLSSTLGNSNAGDILLVTDIIGEININSSGNFGKNGKNTSVLCAENFKSGKYGQEAMDYWESRDSSLPPNNCVGQDLSYLNGTFTCPSGYDEKINPEINVERIIYKRKCAALYTKTRCLKRQYLVNCKMNVIRGRCGDQVQRLEDNGKYYISKNPRISNDPSKCSINSNGLYNSGDIFNVDYIVDEKDIIGFASTAQACEYLFDKANYFKASFKETISIDGHYQEIETYEKTVTFLDSEKRKFNWPLPNNIKDSKGDDLDSHNMYIMIESWLRNGQSIEMLNTLKNSKDKLFNIRGFKNCMGLDGSSPTDYECEKELGDEFKVKFYIIDKYGKRSNPLIAKIPASNSRLVYVYAYGYYTQVMLANVTDPIPSRFKTRWHGTNPLPYCLSNWSNVHCLMKDWSTYYSGGVVEFYRPGLNGGKPFINTDGVIQFAQGGWADRYFMKLFTESTVYRGDIPDSTYFTGARHHVHTWKQFHYANEPIPSYGTYGD